MIKPIVLFISILILEACVNRLEVPDSDVVSGVIVVDGHITDSPGPYQIRLFKASSNEAVLNAAQSVIAREVVISSDDGEQEILTSSGDGIYKTSKDGIRGQIGKKYMVRIELLNGTIIESEPDEMKLTGKIDSIFYEWESTQPLVGPTQYGFRIYLNSSANKPTDYIRWRYSGTFVIESFPHLRRHNDGNCTVAKPPPDPPPCSGYVYNHLPGSPGAPPQGNLEYVGECTCCICWVTEYENKPHLSPNEIVTDGSYKNVEIGYVPFESWTFGKGKYMIKAEQMSLSKEAFEFWKIFKDQKDGANSLFQPSFGRPRTNLSASNANQPVTGIFYATSIETKIIFLTPLDAPVPVPNFDVEPPIDNCALWRSCEVIFLNSSTAPPPEWE